MKSISEKDPLCCPIHGFMLFLDEIAKAKDIYEVLLELVGFLYAFFSLKVQNLVLKIDLVNRRLVWQSLASPFTRTVGFFCGLLWPGSLAVNYE